MKNRTRRAFRFGGKRIDLAERETIEESLDELWRRYAASRDDFELRNRLAERYVPLVRRHAERAAADVRRRLTASLRGRIRTDDLESAGMLGLLDAVSSFDPAEGKRFDDYAAVRIQSAIAEELRSLDWLPLSFFAKGIRRDGDPPESEP